MSFRRAQDPTSIAQLVGRMIRTPLVRRIESDGVLNTVELFLPHYDSEALEGVLTKLRNPDEHEGVPSDVTTRAEEYTRDPAYTDVFDHLATLPTYSVGRAPKMSDVKRALRLAGSGLGEILAPGCFLYASASAGVGLLCVGVPGYALTARNGHW